jgi:hypothetical protein
MPVSSTVELSISFKQSGVSLTHLLRPVIKTILDIFVVLFVKYNLGDEIEGEMGSAWSTHWTDKNTYSILAGKPESKRPFGKPKRRAKGSVKMELK